MGHDAQLDLRIIGGHDRAARRRDEGFPDAAALGGADRDVLQVGIVAREPPGHGYRLSVGGVHPPGRRVDHSRQLVGVGGFQLGKAAILQDQFRQRVIEGKLLEHVLVGGGRAAGRFLENGQPALLEQDFLYLAR
jgi:hypothetical protein